MLEVLRHAGREKAVWIGKTYSLVEYECRRESRCESCTLCQVLNGAD